MVLNELVATFIAGIAVWTRKQKRSGEVRVCLEEVEQ